MIKSVFEKLPLELSAPKADRFFESYEEASAYCEKQSTKGYESDVLSRYRFEKLTNFQNSNGNLLVSPSATILLCVLAVYLKGNNNKLPNFIDFGGACGESVLLLSSIFGGKYIKRVG